MTEEERKERKRERVKKYYEANKEKNSQATWAKEYRKKNKGTQETTR